MKRILFTMHRDHEPERLQGRAGAGALASWSAAVLRRFCSRGPDVKAPEGWRSPKPRGATAGSWRACFRLRACMGTINRSAPDVGQASRLPAQAGSLRYLTGETPVLPFGSWRGNTVGCALAAGILGVSIAFTAVAAGPSEESGFKSLFNGKDLNGWAADDQGSPRRGE